MEQVKTFEQWLSQMLKDSKEKLDMTDATIAYLLLREGTHYYLKTICETHHDENLGAL